MKLAGVRIPCRNTFEAVRDKVRMSVVYLQANSQIAPVIIDYDKKQKDELIAKLVHRQTTEVRADGRPRGCILLIDGQYSTPGHVDIPPLRAAA